MTAFWRLFGKKGRKAGASPRGSIDCSGVMKRLYEYIDGELDDETLVKIRRHLEVCKKCYPHYQFEKAFLHLLGDQGRASAPSELRRRIFRSILEGGNNA